MKYFLLTVVAVIIFANCESKKSSINSLDSTNQRSNFLAILNGTWVETSYFDSLILTKSPYNSQNALAQIVEFGIDSTKAKADSMEIDALNIHEGTTLMIYFRPGRTETSLQFSLKDYDTKSNYYELGYNSVDKDTFLVLYHYDGNNKLLSETKYRKITGFKENVFQYLVNKTLVSGTYELIDTSVKKTTIHFDNDGKVKGFLNYTSYYVLTDFVADTDSSGDQICFDLQTAGQNCYNYRFSKDTLLLFHQEKSTERYTDNFHYKLIKKQ